MVPFHGCASNAARPRRRGDRIAVPFAAVHMSLPVQGFGCRPCRRSQVHGGRRPKAAKERTRDGGTCVVPHAWSYVGLERQCNLEMMARMLLTGDFMFCAAFDFNELRVAKIAHSTTLAR